MVCSPGSTYTRIKSCTVYRFGIVNTLPSYKIYVHFFGFQRAAIKACVIARAKFRETIELAIQKYGELIRGVYWNF
jgi:hypothetical protein